MTLSSPDIQYGSPLSITATFDPSVGDPNLKDMLCEYTQPGGSSPNFRLTTYHTGARQIILATTLTPSESARLTIASSGNPMVLTIAPIAFEDEKRQFFCTVEYYVGLAASSIRSELRILENVYSKFFFSKFRMILVLLRQGRLFIK